MIRSNEKGRTGLQTRFTDFVHARTIECEDLIQVSKVPGDGRVTFDSNVTFRNNLRVLGALSTVELQITSDKRLKSNIEPINSAEALHTIDSLGVYSYKLNNKDSIGYLAQEIRELVPSAVGGDDDTVLTLKPGQMLALQSAAIQQLLRRVRTLEQQLAVRDESAPSVPPRGIPCRDGRKVRTGETETQQPSSPSRSTPGSPAAH